MIQMRVVVTSLFHSVASPRPSQRSLSAKVILVVEQAFLGHSLSVVPHVWSCLETQEPEPVADAGRNETPKSLT